jgi:hypothetical protein
MYEPWMIESAYGIAAMLPGDPQEALTTLNMFDGIDDALPDDPKEALLVLGLVKALVERMNELYCRVGGRRLRKPPRLVGLRSGASRRLRPRAGDT